MSYHTKRVAPMPGYWFGPYNVLVPNSVPEVPAADGVNSYYKDGSQTEVHVFRPLPSTEWLAKYSYVQNDLMYYKEKNDNE